MPARAFAAIPNQCRESPTSGKIGDCYDRTVVVAGWSERHPLSCCLTVCDPPRRQVLLGCPNAESSAAATCNVETIRLLSRRNNLQNYS
jgi:hypothetical protein